MAFACRVSIPHFCKEFKKVSSFPIVRQVSLKELGISYIDAVLLHSPLPTPAETLQAWRGLEDAVDSGKVRALGISNCHRLSELQNLHASARIKPVIVQNRFYMVTKYDCELRKWCKENGIQYQGFWTLTANTRVLKAPAVQREARRLAITPEMVSKT